MIELPTRRMDNIKVRMPIMIKVFKSSQSISVKQYIETLLVHP